MEELHHKQTKPIRRPKKTAREKLVLQAKIHKAQASAGEPQKSQSLLSSEEAEMLQVKFPNLDRKNAMLEHKNLKLSSEPKQVETKQDSEGSVQHLIHRFGHLQKRIRNLELEQADDSAYCRIIATLGEDLKTWREQLVAVEKMIKSVGRLEMASRESTGSAGSSP